MDFLWSKDIKPEYAVRLVWKSLKSACDTEEGVCYHNYPMFSVDKTRRAPDILMLHRQGGLYFIECQPWRIEDIKSIDGDDWYIEGAISPITPFLELEDQVSIVLSKFSTERELRKGRGGNVVEAHKFLALPHIYRSTWEEKQFNKYDKPSNLFIFADDLKLETLQARLQHMPEDEKQTPFTEEQWKIAKTILTGSSVLRRERRPEAQKAGTKANFLRQVEAQIQDIDTQQQKIAIQIPDGPQRIRGIAGSGKTVIMCMKAAIMHHKNPDWDIVYTFYTRSLYAQIKSLIARFYRYFAIDNVQTTPNWNKLHILHGWGSENAPGVYSSIAKHLNRDPFTYREAKAVFHFKEQSELLGRCCKDLLKNSRKVPRLFDVILIDEAQDFHFDFYKLCYSILREPKRLIWAYDEVQSLESLSIPTTIDIFGTHPDGSPIVSLEGTYTSEGATPEEEIEKDLILNRCYRNPRPILITAHMFGMGLQRPQGAVQFIPNRGGWEDIGYEVVKGEFEPGHSITIRRPIENSPHKLEKLAGYKDLVRWQDFQNRTQELDWIALQIKNNIEQDELKPEDIVVISLDWKQMSGDFRYLTQKLNLLNIQLLIAEKENFQEKGKVTLSGIFRAKGNEASVVYVMGFEQVDSNPNVIVQDRNQAFTAMTRTRGWCILTGVGIKAKLLFEEIDKIISSDPEKIEFTVPDPKTIQRNLDSLEYERRRNRAKKVKELTKKLASEAAEDPSLIEEAIKTLENLRRTVKE